MADRPSNPSRRIKYNYLVLSAVQPVLIRYNSQVLLSPAQNHIQANTSSEVITNISRLSKTSIKCRYLSTLLHACIDKFQRSYSLYRETTGIYLYYSKSLLRGYSLNLYYLSLLYSLPSFLQIYTIINRQGGNRRELKDYSNKISDSIVNSVLFSIRD